MALASHMTPLITNDAGVFGALLAIIASVFYCQQINHRFVRLFFTVFPTLLLCYFLPSLLNSFNIVDPSQSNVYYFASRYLLPAAIVLLTLSIDFKTIFNLGPKLLYMFVLGGIGIVVGGPLSLLLLGEFYPDLLTNTGNNSVWRGMTTVAGSWIGGGANQAAMKEIYQVGDHIFSAMIAVDVIVANVWMAVLLFIASKQTALDKRFGADPTLMQTLEQKSTDFSQLKKHNPSVNQLLFMFGLVFFIVGVSHLLADYCAAFFKINYPETRVFSFHSHFFWLIFCVTSIGLSVSFTRARKFEEIGASKYGQVFIYILVAAIGLNMDLTAIADSPLYFILGAIWILFHALIMVGAALLLKVPMFYMAVASQANIGGAASAPIVASAFNPAFAPIGVLLAVIGYALGTYMAWFCGQVLQVIAQ